MCDIFNVSMAKAAPTKITDSLLRERLMPMTRATFIRELTDTAHWKQGKTPDLALLHRVYAESGTKIPLNDWFQVRRTRMNLLLFVRLALVIFILGGRFRIHR